MFRVHHVPGRKCSGGRNIICPRGNKTCPNNKDNNKRDNTNKHIYIHSKENFKNLWHFQGKCGKINKLDEFYGKERKYEAD